VSTSRVGASRDSGKGKAASYMLQDKLAHAARQHQTGDKPNDDRIVPELLGDRIARSKTMDEIYDILDYIASKAGPF
jgi:hypothetical protein